MNVDGLRPWGGLVVDGQSDVVVAGLPYDGSAVYRKGAAQGPARLRELSAVMPPVTELGTPLRLSVRDIGDIQVGHDISTGWAAAADRLAQVPAQAFLTTLGGDHCVAIATLAAQQRRHPGVSLLLVDAHPDLCDFSRGGRWTCGCALRRGLEVAGVDPSRVVIAGARDFDPEEVQFIEQNEVLLVTAAEIARDPVGSADRIAERLEGADVQVSFDVDVLDPAFAPGTEIPSGGGLSTREALELLRAATRRSTLVGFEVVELSPPIDHSDITSFAALKLIFEVWGMLQRAHGKS